MKTILFLLILLLIVVLIRSYYVNKEGFDNVPTTTTATAKPSDTSVTAPTNTPATSSTTVAPAAPVVPSSTTVSTPAPAAPVVPSSITVSTPAPSSTTVSTPAPVTSTTTAVPSTMVSGSIPQNTQVQSEVSISKTGHDAAVLQEKMDLLKNIQKIVRNELLSTRSTEPVIPLGKRSSETDSTAQGKEYSTSCYKDTSSECQKNLDGTCPPLPDMSNYIKKDKIPCWGCTLDY